LELGKISRDFFNCLFELPLLQSAQKRNKKIEPKKRGEKNKMRENKAILFLMRPDRFFSTIFSLPRG
jgi:hypothetical protein